MNEIMLRGRRLRLADDKPTFWAKAAAGDWEPETLEAIEDTVRPGVVFLDIGAWVGPTALYAAALGAHVVAVEADPVAFAALKANTGANADLAARMTLIHGAAARRAGTLRLGAPRKLGDSMGSQFLADKTANGFEAKAITPGEIATMLPNGPVVLKIDIEGGEYDLLPAMGPFLPRVTAALVAFHPALARAIGRDETAIRRWNDHAFELFSGFDRQALGWRGPEDPREIAFGQNCAVRFDRVRGPGPG